MRGHECWLLAAGCCFFLVFFECYNDYPHSLGLPWMVGYCPMVLYTTVTRFFFFLGRGGGEGEGVGDR